MGSVAFVFAGQGAQVPGMGKELYEQSKAAREVFDRLEAIRPGTLEMCFNGSAEDLAKTINTAQMGTYVFPHVMLKRPLTWVSQVRQRLLTTA